jgi:hypothetical protein
MPERSSAIAKSHAPTVSLPRRSVSAIDTNVRRVGCRFAANHGDLSDDKIQALVQRLSTLEDSVRSTTRMPSVTASEFITSSTNPEASTSPEQPSKRRRTGSSATAAVSANVVEIETTQQPATEARNLISKELSTNVSLSVHQRSVLETAISFVDHLSHAPVPTITDRSTFDKSMYISTNLSQGEILHVILASQYSIFSVSPSLIPFHQPNQKAWILPRSTFTALITSRLKLLSVLVLL